MKKPRRKIAFVLAASDHGTVIVNRLDYRMIDQTRGYGVGFQILGTSQFDPDEVGLAVSLLQLRKKYFGDGVIAIDCGANIGVHTIEWAKSMTGWGSVISIEAQERIFYALAGNIAINNCFNARAIFAAVDSKDGTMKVPQPDYLSAASFGSLELRQRENTEFIGQKINYNDESTAAIRTMSLDSLALSRIDLIKIDIEGMELEALHGSIQSIKRNLPILIVESVKSDKVELKTLLENLEYRVFKSGLNFLAIHKSDRSLMHIDKKTNGKRTGSTVPDRPDDQSLG